MTRKYIAFILLFATIFIKINIINAEDIATCTYELKEAKFNYSIEGADYSGFSKILKLKVSANDKGEKSIGYTGVSYPPYWDETLIDEEYNSFFEGSYTDFMKDKKFTCPDKVYIERCSTRAKDGRSDKYTDIIRLKDSKERNSSSLGFCRVWYAYHFKDSDIIFENYDESYREKQNFIKTCNYNSYVLSFNETDVYINISRTSTQILPTDTQMIQYIRENGYACPAYLCYNDGVSGTDHSTPTKTYYFSETSNGRTCIVSSDYSSKYICGSLQTKFDAINKLGGDQSASSIANINKLKNDIKAFCNNANFYLNYNDSNNCVKECIEISDLLNEYEFTISECGFSDRLLAIINNILRWIKYILPAIVIILGIIDFMKAVGSDKEDEMKKAQKKFIIRLISAALVFIVPLIITFILDKMGFTANSCGIDLFK